MRGLGNNMKVRAELRVNGKKIVGSITESFLDTIVRRNMGTYTIGKITYCQIKNPSGAVIFLISPPTELSYTYDDVNKKYTIYAKWEWTSDKTDIMDSVEIYAENSATALTLISLFENIGQEVNEEEQVALEYKLYLTHDDKSQFHSEKLTEELIGSIAEDTYSIVSVKLYDSSETLIKEVTNKTSEAKESGTEDGSLYYQLKVRFKDESTDTYTVAKAEYIDEHGNVYVKHEGLSVEKKTNQPLTIDLFIRNLRAGE